MNPSAWIAMASLAVVFIAYAVTTSFMAGRLFQRVSTLEKRDDLLARLDSTVTRMDANMGHLTASVDELKGKLMWPTEPPVRQSRQRAVK